MEVQTPKKDRHLPNHYFIDNFEWKKENRNLQKFIENQHLAFYKPTKYRQFLTNHSEKNHQLFLMKSLENINFEPNTSPKRFFSPETTILKENNNLLTEREFEEKIHKNEELLNSRFSILMTEKKDFGIQTSEEDFIGKRKKSVEESNCMKELIKILEKQILTFSKTISEDREQINVLNLEIKELKEKLIEEKEEIEILNEKLKKETELNEFMEYIIAELNEKVRTLMERNTELEEIFEEISENEEEKTIYGYIDSQSSLSMNSEINKNFKSNDMFKHNESICEETASNIFPLDQENWSCTLLEMSSFNKTPNKIHEVLSNEDNLTNEQKNENFSQGEMIEEIMKQHQIEISKLNETIKYYEIENLMLKRKKELSEKNNEEVIELKTRIEKLLEQNKIIKLLQNKNLKKLETSDPKIKKQTKPNKFAEGNLEFNKFEDKEEKIKANKKEKSEISFSDVDNDPNNRFESKEKERTKSLKNDKENIKRKNPLERKFVRKQRKSPKSSKLNSDEELEVSLSLSPERI